MKKFVVLAVVSLSGMLWAVSCMAGDRSDVKGASTATFAGGCFWCVEADFEKLPGVLEVDSGYTGGLRKNPTYKQVSSGSTGHVEAVRVFYDSEKVSYPELVEYFWRHVDPTDSKGQFVDRGQQYRPAIFYEDEEQKLAAELSMKRLDESGRFDGPVVTQILPAGEFYEAEDYHQDYYKKNPIRYRLYRYNSGRDRFLSREWSEDEMTKLNSEEETQEARAQTYEKPSDEVLRKKLTPLQYKVTQKEGTEPAFNNQYWNNKADGIYVDVVSGEPLFSSVDKFESKTGWPSFTRPLESANIVEKTDRTFFMTRTEVRSRGGDSHLGHVFPDGPAPTRQRYCMNSAALRFVPKEDLVKEGYGKYLSLFEE